MESRETQRPSAPEFAAPVDPGDDPRRGLALVAQIVRGREIAADAAGMPPLDSDQVLDLQRSAGNRLTANALARWMPEDGDIAQRLLEQLIAAPDEVVAAALDALRPRVVIEIAGPGEATDVDVTGPRGGGAFHVTPPATVELSFGALFGPAAGVRADHDLKIAIGQREVVLRPPFEAVDGVSVRLRA